MFKLLYVIFFCSSFLLSQDLEVDPVFTGAFGSATINDKIYNQFSIRPEFAFEKFAMGLDIYFYFDENGELYSKNWNFTSSKSTLQTIVDKIYYVRWGQPEDDMYFRIGSLPTITLGHGSLVSNYSNSTDYPRVRRTGFNFKKKINNYTLEIIHSNLKNIFEPAVFGINNTFDFSNQLKLNVALVADFNQQKGLVDSDSDGVPDYLEPDFANDENQWFAEQFYIEDNVDCIQGFAAYNDLYGGLPEEESAGSCYCEDNSETCLDGDLYNTKTACEDTSGIWVPHIAPNGVHDYCDQHVNNAINNFFDSYNLINEDDQVSGISFGVSYDLSSDLYIYSEFSKLYGNTSNPYSDDDSFDTKLGYGFIPIGLKGDWDKFSIAVDFRQNSDNYIYNYWDRNYDHSRIVVNPVEDDSNSLITKESQLYNYGESNGMSINITSNLLKFFNISFDYQHLNTRLWNQDLGDYKTDSNKSLYAKLDLDTSMINKIRIAEIFYQKINVKDIFDSQNNENSLLGYNLGLQMSEDMVFILKGRKTYVQNENGDYEPFKTTQIETQILF